MPSNRTLLDGGFCADVHAQAHINEQGADDRHFPAHHDMRCEMVRRLGAWERPHPYISALVGAEALSDALSAVLNTLPLGEGHSGTFFMATDDVPR